MITDRARFKARHAQICERAERQFLDQKKRTPKFGIRQAIASYSLAIRAAIARKDATGIAGVHAAAAAHLALKFSRQQCSSESRAISKRRGIHSARREPAPHAVVLSMVVAARFETSRLRCDARWQICGRAFSQLSVSPAKQQSCLSHLTHSF